MLRRFARILLRAVLLFMALVCCYALAAWLLPLVPVNRDYQEPPEGVPIYIRSNGVHTDIILPLRSPVKDWSTELPFAHTASSDSGLSHVAFGWGDKGFYLETKEWADLKASTAFKAAFGLSGSAMHIAYCDTPSVGERCRSVRVDRARLALLARSVAKGFREGSATWIPGHHYELHDAFYEGSGRYGLFFTCNTWANSVLKDCGLPAALWTATAGGVLRQYR